MDAEFSKVDVAHAKIKTLVTRYDFVAERHLRILPGQHLHIDELSDRIKVSATPVRQALERLHGEGLIDCIPRRGFFSKVPDATELQELYEFALLVLDRSLLAARDVVGTGALKPDLSVGTTPVRPRSEGDHQTNALFLEAVSEWIASLSKNSQMLRMMKNFHDRSRYVRCLTLVNCRNMSIHFAEIMKLIDLVRTGRTDSARAIVHAQMTHEIAHLPDIIRHARTRWASPEANDLQDARRLEQTAAIAFGQLPPEPSKRSFRNM